MNGVESIIGSRVALKELVRQVLSLPEVNFTLNVFNGLISF